jgi:hypothetical protein
MSSSENRDGQIPTRQNADQTQRVAEKQKIIQHIQGQSQTNPDCEKMIPVLEKIENRQYANASDVTQAAGLVQ